MGDSSAERRIAAVVLPELLVELASSRLAVGSAPAQRSKLVPLGVVMTQGAAAGEEIAATAVLGAVNAAARRFGVRSMQTIAEACALVSNLVVRSVSQPEVSATLGRIAEVALGFGATVSLEAPDTVWVDISGAAHLWGSEAALAAELSSRVRALGHAARVAIASGPRLAQAFGRWAPPGSGPERAIVVSAERTQASFSELPLCALPLDEERRGWLVRLGVITVGDLAALPRAAAAARLGNAASRVLDLCAGRDREPLVAYVPPSIPVEETAWDEPVSGIEPLLFVLRGLTARLSGRLAGRGEAAQKLALVIRFDAAIARLEGIAPERTLLFDLASPLWREEEIRRVVVSRLERTKLGAPSVALRLEAPAVIRALGRQLDLSRVAGGVTGDIGLESLPVVLAELGADIGKQNFGVLRLIDDHRPEAQSALVPALEPVMASRLRPPKKTRPKQGGLKKSGPRPSSHERAPARLLAEPVRIDAALRPGATLRIDHRLYTIERVRFDRRLDGVGWWQAPIARDYLRLWLQGSEGGFEALVHVDRASGTRFLSGIDD
jgi:protein ImuB